LAVVALGAFVWQQQSKRNNPETVFKDALRHSLQTQKVAIAMKSADLTLASDLDMTNIKDPLLSTKSNIESNGTRYDLEGYGTFNDTYISYSNLPATTPKTVANIADGAWVHIRVKGFQPPDIPPLLNQASDPTFYMFGPLVFANLPEKDQTQLIEFMQKNKVYGYDVKQVKKVTVSGQKLWAYPLKLQVGFLKVAAQSAATNEHINVDKLTAAMVALDDLKGASATMYISAKDHTFAQFNSVKDGQTTVRTYTYQGISIPSEPPTKLTWQAFAPLQTQIVSPASTPTR
jgi:hypothetical protein